MVIEYSKLEYPINWRDQGCLGSERRWVDHRQEVGQQGAGVHEDMDLRPDQSPGGHGVPVRDRRPLTGGDRRRRGRPEREDDIPRGGDRAWVAGARKEKIASSKIG